MLEPKTKAKMYEQRPLIVTFIGDISVLCASLSVLAVLFPDFLQKLGFAIIPVPFFSEGIMKVILPFAFLIATLGFIRLKKWGYWLLIICNIIFLAEGIVCALQNKQSPGNIITFIELLFIIPTKRYFDQKGSVAAK